MSRDEEKRIGDDMTLCDAQRIISERILDGEDKVIEDFMWSINNIVQAQTLTHEEY